MTKKTFKREMAMVMFAWLGYLTYGDNVDVKLIEVLVWPIFTFGALSFGLSWVSKSNIVLRAESPESSNR